MREPKEYVILIKDSGEPYKTLLSKAMTFSLHGYVEDRKILYPGFPMISPVYHKKEWPDDSE